MSKQLKSTCFAIAFGVVLFVLLLNFGAVMGFLGTILSIFMPIIAGFVTAFILNVPMSGFERLLNKMLKNKKKKPKESVISVISLVPTLLALILILSLVVTLIIPAVCDSVDVLIRTIKANLPQWAQLLNKYGLELDIDKITAWINSLDLKALVSKLSGYAGSIIVTTFGALSTAVSTIANVCISAVIAIYVLLTKKQICSKARQITTVYLPKAKADLTFHVCDMITRSYSKFLSGQCVESCILGGMVFISFAVFKIPYAGLTGLLSGVMAFIPYVGAFGACAIGAFLVLLTEPSKFILCIVIYLVVQFIETQFVYPHVVGSSVGLSPLWTIIAVLIGGSLFGLMGMIFFTPLVAVLLQLFEENIKKRTEKSGIVAPDNTAEDQEGSAK